MVLEIYFAGASLDSTLLMFFFHPPSWLPHFLVKHEHILLKIHRHCIVHVIHVVHSSRANCSAVYRIAHPLDVWCSLVMVSLLSIFIWHYDLMRFGVQISIVSSSYHDIIVAWYTASLPDAPSAPLKHLAYLEPR